MCTKKRRFPIKQKDLAKTICSVAEFHRELFASLLLFVRKPSPRIATKHNRHTTGGIGVNMTRALASSAG